MTKSLLADIANLMLRSHFELSRISPSFVTSVDCQSTTQSARRRGPVTLVFGQNGQGNNSLEQALGLAAQKSQFNFVVTADPETEVSCSYYGSGLLRMSAVSKGQTYSVDLPTRADAETLKATVILRSPEFSGCQLLSAADFLAGKGIPENFKTLHDVIVSHAKRYLGWKSESGQDGGDEKPSNVTAASEARPDAPEHLEYRLRRTEDKDLVFVGRHLGSVASPDYNGRFWRYSMFQTKGGKWIGVKEGITRRVGESDKVAAIVADTPEGTQKFFGAGFLAKALYAKLGIDHSERVD